jgi:hypothetical protein
MIEAKAIPDEARAGFPPGSAFIKEAELWIGAQGDILTAIETMMTGWMQRQRRAFEASSRSVQKIYDARNIFDVLQAQQDLVSDCLSWTASEIRAVGSEATAITRTATEQLGERAERQSSWLSAGQTGSHAPLERAAAE